MATELAARPSATTYDVETLVNMAWTGQIRVPHFQRSFRWQRADVVKLFDSIMRGYPVGSLLLWLRSAPAEKIRLGALELDAPETSEALWVVDGQQRITSLACALHEKSGDDPRFSLAYDLRSSSFIARPAAEDPLVVPLPVIFDLRKVLQWFRKYPDAADYVDRANAVTKMLRQFQIPAYLVRQEDAKVLQDIFDRMNNYGKRLSRAEVFSALFAGEEETKDDRLTLGRIASHIDTDLGFGTIDEDTVLKAVLARRNPDVLREIRNEFATESRQRRGAGRSISGIPREGRDPAYEMGEEALRLAVAFLQREAGVPHFTMLAYRHLLVVLARFFAHFPDLDERNLRLLRRWYWRAAVTGPEIFPGATTGAIRALCGAVKPGDVAGSIAKLHKLVDRPDSRVPNLERFRANEASTKIVLCAWWAAGPRSLEDGSPVTEDDLSACLMDRNTAGDATRYIVPRTAIPVNLRLWSANRLLLPDLGMESGAVQSLITSPRHGLCEAEWRAILASHMIDAEAAELLAQDRIEKFLQKRQETLRVQLTDYLKRMCEWGFENTPSLDDLEIEDLGEDTDGSA